MSRSLVLMIAIAAALVTPGAAYAYPGDSTDPSRTDCVDCHGASETDILEPGGDPALLAATRKGPHGGYTPGTAKCLTCHVTHQAASSENLLPEQTVSDMCTSCHDGTGGAAVYGVIKARTGQDPGATHRINTTDVVPGGASDGSAASGSFLGPNGTLTCIDCHSAHDSQTVDPFLGDRLRASETSDTGIGIPTNRLLRQQPSGADVSVEAYGVGWCASCHEGRLLQHAEGSGVIEKHPVAQDDTYTYASTPVVTGVGSAETELGSLGQSNRGYVMPGPDVTEPTLKTPLQEGRGPLCQQCHEDARDVGPSGRRTNPALTAAGQEFRVTAYGEDASPYDNPRFQVFPHESENASFLVRAPEPAEPYSLCLNCHSLRHDAVPGSGDVMIFEPGQHDDALPGFPTEPYVVYVDCTICHTTDLNAVHAQQCLACHTTPYDTLGSWDNSCQQGGCHVTIHDGVAEAHDPWADSYGSGQCGLCHTSGIGPPNQSKCANCHTLYSASDTTAPVTSSNAIASYVGAAFIEFSITDSGKVGVGTTFYRLDGGDTEVGGSLTITTPGAHTLEFWSVDQAGNVESPVKTASFTIAEDTTPPVTTSNAVAGGTYYYNTVYITLTATDASSLGAKTTYYSLDDGPVQTGSRVTVLAPSGSFPHTLEFWSEDWSGNVEATNTVSFTVVGGTGTIRFNTGTLAPDEWVEWQVWRGAPSGDPHWTVLHEYPFSGYGDLSLPVSGTDYYVREAWGTATEPYDEHNWGYYPIRTPDTFIQIP